MLSKSRFSNTVVLTLVLLLVGPFFRSNQANAEGSILKPVPASHKSARMLAKIWQPALDSMISDGDFSVVLVKATAEPFEQKFIEKLVTASEEKIVRQFKRLKRKNNRVSNISTDVRSCSDAFLRAVVRSYEAAIGSSAWNQETRERLRATLKRLDFDLDKDGICAESTAVGELVTSSQEKDPRKISLITILDSKSKTGLVFYSQEGRM